ncbi:hypothetical protein [Streptomyces muensis]|uniref:Uncharacterized protein n=1 Tax=Streptomyces muensis TaxID=1077944 RepID=A0A9X1Q2X2_STRM4|nr:hypothetical protein [Streptomyces muensis]MCF1597967.1 hypothetical protein [Streptomyces muensis]
MAAVRRSVPLQDQHPVLRGVFEDWQSRAGVLSALPGAPVVPDGTRRGRSGWRRLRIRPARTADTRRGRRSGPAAPPLPS